MYCIGLNWCLINNPVEVAVRDLAPTKCVSKMPKLFSVYSASNLTRQMGRYFTDSSGKDSVETVLKEKACLPLTFKVDQSEFGCQLSQVSTAWGFLRCRHRPAACRDPLQHLTKLLPKPVARKQPNQQTKALTVVLCSSFNAESPVRIKLNSC